VPVTQRLSHVGCKSLPPLNRLVKIVLPSFAGWTPWIYATQLGHQPTINRRGYMFGFPFDSNPELKQCPYDRATKCAMEFPCEGCEVKSEAETPHNES